MMTPQFQQAARLLEPKIRLAKANTNTEAELYLTAQFGMRTIPTLGLFQGEREIAHQVGIVGAQDIVRWASLVQAGR